MASESRKHRAFVAGPMFDKPATIIPGIDEELGRRLEVAGFDKAYTLLGIFLLFKKQEEFFVEWMELTVKANAQQATLCYEGLAEWCDEFL